MLIEPVLIDGNLCRKWTYVHKTTCKRTFELCVRVWKAYWPQFLNISKMSNENARTFCLLKTACVNEMVIIDSGSSLSFIWRPAITWTNADLFSTGPVKTNFSEISIKTQAFFQQNAFESVTCSMSGSQCILVAVTEANRIYVSV